MPYFPRVVDDELGRRLRVSGAVVVEGPKACGKTQTARQRAGSEVLLDVDPNARAAVAIDPSLVLDGPAPRLLDEWQVVPELWNHVRRRVDALAEPGLFLLTGSAVPADDASRHTGAGRFSRLRMRPMSLWESGISSGAVRLTALLSGEPPRAADPGTKLDDLITAVVVGGWPALRGVSVEDAMQANRDYLEQVRRTDVQRVDGVSRDPERVGAVLRSVARHASTQAKLSTLTADAAGGSALTVDTVSAYLQALSRLMVIEDLPAWAPHLRSSHRLRQAPTRHFVDPSLAVAALQATPSALRADLNTFGLLFESLVVRDLRVYAQACGAAVAHYRDSAGLEVDAVITGDDGRWAAFEVKLAANEATIEQAAASLLRFKDRVDHRMEGEPAALVVVTGSGYAYRRADGIDVVPIATLAP